MEKIPIVERKLNEEQKRAVEFGEGPLMIIAGAGTGKTTVVTERIKYLITSGKAKPQEILALSFTEKSAREMEERVDQVLPYGMTNLWISTFHSFCDRILKAEAINIGLDPGYTLMSEVDAITFFRKHLFEFELDYFRPLGNPTKFIRGMLTHFNRLKDEDVDSIQYMNWMRTQNSEPNDQIIKYRELAGAYRKYEELKIKHEVADYADLIANTLQVFRKRKDVLGRYQEQFKYILIDEFQDTNFAQNQLGIMLAGERQNITVVGDDDQAIYRWRGAAVSNMIQFREYFPKLAVITLTQNYRSTKEILDRAYDLIQFNNPDRLEVAEKIEKKLESMRRIAGVPVEVLYANRVEEEADLVVKQIQNVKIKNQNYGWKDFAILVRANNHAEPFVRALTRAGIPYQFLGPGQLLRQPEVKDLIAYLKVLANYEDNVAMYRVLSMEWTGLSGREIATLINYAKKSGVSVFEACELCVNPQGDLVFHGVPLRASPVEDFSQRVRKIVGMMHKHFELLKRETAGQILYRFLEETGLLRFLANYKTTKEEKQAMNIAKFFDRLKTYEVEHEDASVFAVTDWLELAVNLGESPAAANEDWSENDAVNILTIHSAKGLEFPVVFVTNLVAGRFPTTERKEQISIPDELVKEILPEGDFHLEEERRLFYVAITRARDELYLTAARYYGEGKREKKLSPFVQETLGERISNIQYPISNKESKQLSFLDWRMKEAEVEKKIKQEINFVSYSQLETFTTCPLQYKYRYIVKIPVSAGSALVFGDAIHRVLKQFYDKVKNREKVTTETLLNIYKDVWTTTKFTDLKQREKMYEHGEELLCEFFEKGFDPTIIPVHLEEAFRIKLTPKLTLGGKIDRIDEFQDGKIEVIDYKTGQTPKGRDPKKDLQLSVYALSALEMTGGKKKVADVTLSFYFLEGQEKISASRTEEELKAAKETVVAKVNEIEVSDFRPTPGKHCDFCDFRLICEAWQ